LIFHFAACADFPGSANSLVLFSSKTAKLLPNHEDHQAHEGFGLFYALQLRVLRRGQASQSVLLAALPR
jgi:hypothetical protein